MTRPLIGVSGQRIDGDAYVQCYPAYRTVAADLHWSSDSDAILEAGGLPVLIPQSVPVNDVVDRLDGLFVTGGADIDPSRYGQDRHASVRSVEPARDQFELDLVAAALAQRLPILGVCRGVQLLNVQAGGSLAQHVPTHTFMDENPSRHHHVVNFAPDCRLHAMYGDTLPVNSLHHQGLGELGAGYIAAGRTDDGLIEAIEHAELPVLGVQWHPELLDSRPHDPLFRWLVDQAANQQSTTVPPTHGQEGIGVRNDR